MPPPDEIDDAVERPLELILARNLVSIISLAAFLVDVDGDIVFFNDAAAEVIGHHDPAHDDARLDALGEQAAERWAARGPGAPLELAREGQAFEL